MKIFAGEMLILETVRPRVKWTTFLDHSYKNNTFDHKFHLGLVTLTKCLFDNFCGKYDYLENGKKSPKENHWSDLNAFNVN